MTLPTTDGCDLCARAPMHRGEWEPFESYRAGDTVDDSRSGPEYDDELPGKFRALNCLRSGLLPPRYVVLDTDNRWERIA